MTRAIYGVFDRTAGQVLHIFDEIDDEPAIRSFVFSIGSNPFYRQNCQDFSLLKICIYSTDDGSCIFSSDKKEVVVHCSKQLIDSMFNKEVSEK